MTKAGFMHPNSACPAGPCSSKEQRKVVTDVLYSATRHGGSPYGAGNVCVADLLNHTIRKIAPKGAIGW